MPFLDTHHQLLLAGAREIRRARSAAEAERQLAGGFQPRVVLLELGADARGEALAARMASHPACAEVPILGVSEDAEQRLHLTLLNCAGALSSPSQLADLLDAVEDLCLDPPAASLEEPEPVV